MKAKKTMNNDYAKLVHVSFTRVETDGTYDEDFFSCYSSAVPAVGDGVTIGAQAYIVTKRAWHFRELPFNPSTHTEGEKILGGVVLIVREAKL